MSELRSADPSVPGPGAPIRNTILAIGALGGAIWMGYQLDPEASVGFLLLYVLFVVLPWFRGHNTGFVLALRGFLRRFGAAGGLVAGTPLDWPIDHKENVYYVPRIDTASTAQKKPREMWLTSQVGGGTLLGPCRG